MRSKTLLIGMIAFVLFVAFVIFLSSGTPKINGDVIKGQKTPDPELEKYRNDEIPEECRLPIYEDDLDWWKQHLSHHQQTLYCLDYYK